MPHLAVKSAKEAFRLIGKHPLFFLLLQLPLLLSEVLFRLNMERIEQETHYPTLVLWAVALWIPFYLSHFLVQAATLATLLRIESQGAPSWLGLREDLTSRLAPLLVGGTMVGLTVLIGMRAFILPGVLLFALYLFLPDLIVSHREFTLLAQLRRSWRFAVQNAAVTVVILIVFGIIFIASYGLDQLGPAREGLLTSDWRRWGAELADITFSVLTGMWLHLWVANLYVACARRELA